MKNIIANIKWEIHKDPNKNNAGYIGQILANKCYGKEHTLADAEQMFRDCGTNIYLLALPLESFGNKLLATFFPGDKSYKPYALWICVNGQAEAEQKMMEHGITSIDNLVRLHSCGFLTMIK